MDDAKLIEKLALQLFWLFRKNIDGHYKKYFFGYYFSSFYCCDSSLAAMKKIEKVFVSNASLTAVP